MVCVCVCVCVCVHESVWVSGVRVCVCVTAGVKDFIRQLLGASICS